MKTNITQYIQLLQLLIELKESQELSKEKRNEMEGHIKFVESLIAGKNDPIMTRDNIIYNNYSYYKILYRNLTNHEEHRPDNKRFTNKKANQTKRFGLPKWD